MADHVPALFASYGKSKIGKSVDTVYTAPTALYIAQKGALKGAPAVAGIDIPNDHIVQADTISEVTKVIKSNAGKFPAVVVDDLSIIVDQTVMVLEGDYKDGRQLWGAIRNKLVSLRYNARKVGMHVLFNMHEKKPGTNDKGEFERGGPRLPGRMPEDLPAICDTVVHAVGTDSPFPGYWPAVFECDPMSDFITGDREDIARERSPMNTRELLFGAGFDLPRVHEWQAVAVAKCAEIFLRYEVETGELIDQAEGFVRKKYTTDEKAIRWTVRDALARAQIRRSLNLPARRYGV